MDHEEALTAKVAWYYYCQGLTQQQISDRLDIGRMRIVKLLDRARRTGVIRFHLREGSAERTELERKLIDGFGLSDAFVIPSDENPDRCNANIAEGASMYLIERIRKDTVINIGYGDTLNRVLNKLAAMTEDPVTCVSLTGGVSPYLPDSQTSAFNAHLRLIPAPLLASSSEMAKAMLQEESIAGILRMIPLSQLTVVGIGSMDESATIFRGGLLNQNDLAYLKMRGAVGDLLSHFLTREGDLVESPVENRLIGTSLPTMRSLPLVIGVAAGLVKAEAIRAVLRGRYLSVLITDDQTAEKILSF